MKHCKHCGKELSRKPKERIKEFDNRLVCNRSCAGSLGNKYKIKPIEVYLNNEIKIKSSKLRIRLLKEGIKEYRCEKCKETKWLGQTIPLELHHIDGNHFNNNLINLKILCPNCHSLVPNHSKKK